MPRRNCFRWLRVYLLVTAMTMLLSWFLPAVFLYLTKERDDAIVYDGSFLDNHIYPPPWYMFNWTINDYFLRKDSLKKFDDQNAMRKHQKTVREHQWSTGKRASQAGYVILEYTTVFGRPKFCARTQQSIFGKQCPFQNCRYTCDRSSANSADVLLMHNSDIHFDQLPTQRRSDQIWLYWHDDPHGVPQQATSHQFNWTISYRFNAEASIGAYGLTVLRRRPLPSSEFDFYINEQFDRREPLAIWFVSNCEPKARLQFYQKFRSYYPLIRLHGQCVSPNTTSACPRNSSCEVYELTGNKFYLAFESQSCRDYITEKFWRSLAFGIIPIVFGPRDRQTLERIAPPNSFVFTGDFPSVADLAEHLKEIARNRTLYAEYHRWRRFYEISYRPEDIEPYRFCELCYRLNTNNKRVYYQNLNDFFREDC